MPALAGAGDFCAVVPADSLLPEAGVLLMQAIQLCSGECRVFCCILLRLARRNGCLHADQARDAGWSC